MQDSAAAEEAEQVTQPDSTISNETTTNLLASGNLYIVISRNLAFYVIHFADVSLCGFQA